MPSPFDLTEYGGEVRGQQSQGRRANPVPDRQTAAGSGQDRDLR
jgi:hypothetical protein